MSRRNFLRGSAGAVLLPLLPPVSSGLFAQTPGEPVSGFTFTELEEATFRAAANRIIPPFDNTAFASGGGVTFRGAGEEGAFEYVRNLLTAFDHSPPRIYPGGRDDGSDGNEFGTTLGSPVELTECHGGHQTVAEDVWLELPPEKELGWRAAIARFQTIYREGLALLDADSRALFQVSFPGLRGAQQTLLLQAWDGTNMPSRLGGVYTAGGGEAALRPGFGGFGGGSGDPRSSFFNTFVTHVMEGIYGDPVYGGNLDRIGWKLVAFGGPRHPQGYAPEELESPAACDLGPPFNAKLIENL